MNTTTLKRFLTYYEHAHTQKFDEITISQSMSEDPLLAEIIQLNGGDGQKSGSFLGKPVRVVQDVGMNSFRESIDA